MARQRLTTEQFIAKARAKHDDKYDYSKVQYAGHRSKITIICKEHGEFLQKAGSHLSGHGCSNCCVDKISQKRLTTEQFIAKARAKHDDKYDYSKVQYAGNRSKVTIICKEHGEFLQKAHIHLSGHGCSKCAKININYCKPGRTHMLVKKISFGGRILEHIDLSDDEFMNINSKSPNSRTIGVFN